MRHIRTLYITLLTALALLTAACTRNNGDIGDLFGSWRLDTISMTSQSADGQQLHQTETVADVFWSFQNQVVNLRRLLPNHLSDSRWGTWTRPDDTTLVLIFDHSEASGANPERYEMLPGIHLPAGGCQLSIKQLTPRRMCLIYIDDSDPDAQRAYTYYFTKW